MIDRLSKGNAAVAFGAGEGVLFRYQIAQALDGFLCRADGGVRRDLSRRGTDAASPPRIPHNFHIVKAVPCGGHITGQLEQDLFLIRQALNQGHAVHRPVGAVLGDHSFKDAPRGIMGEHLRGQGVCHILDEFAIQDDASQDRHLRFYTHSGINSSQPHSPARKRRNASSRRSFSRANSGGSARGGA